MTSTTATPETPGAHGADPDGRPAIREGATGSAALVVAPKHLASAFAEEAGEAYPQVLATPALVGLLERACAAILVPALRAGEMSVGHVVRLVHGAPTASGQVVRAKATLLRREKRLYVFEVEARDDAGVVATGEHSRAIVPAAAVEATALRRANGAEEAAR